MEKNKKMKIGVAITIVAIIVIAGTVVGVQRLIDNIKEGNLLTQENRDIYIEITTDKDVYKQGEIVKVMNFTIVNNRDENLSLYISYCITFSNETSEISGSGADIWWVEPTIIPAHHQFTVDSIFLRMEPLDTLGPIATWNQTYVTNTDPTEIWQYEQVPPGIYYVRVEVYSELDTYDDETGKRTVYIYGEKTIEILP